MINFSFCLSQSLNDVFVLFVVGRVWGPWNLACLQRSRFAHKLHWPGLDIHSQSCVFLKTWEAVFPCLLTSQELPSLTQLEFLKSWVGLWSLWRSSLYLQGCDSPPGHASLFVFFPSAYSASSFSFRYEHLCPFSDLGHFLLFFSPPCCLCSSTSLHSFIFSLFFILFCLLEDLPDIFFLAYLLNFFSF